MIIPRKESSKQLRDSDADGKAETGGLSANMEHKFVFEKAGYHDAVAIWEPPERNFLLMSPSGTKDHKPFVPLKDEGVVKIPLYTRAPTTRSSQ